MFVAPTSVHKKSGSDKLFGRMSSIIAVAPLILVLSPPEYFRKPKNPRTPPKYALWQGFLGFLKYSGGRIVCNHSAFGSLLPKPRKLVPSNHGFWL
jgi:hypothetical protein